MTSPIVAEVLVLRGVSAYFSFEIPKHLHSSAVPGAQALIPFGKSQTEGLIMSISTNPTDHPLKPIDTILPTPLIPASQLALIEWIVDYYQTTPYIAYQTVIGTKKARPNEIPPIPEHHPFSTPYDLTTEQSNALQKLLTSPPPHTTLIHGITGSGKTELYMQIASQMINQNKQVIILVPEIALTPQFRKQFKARFGERIALLHSGMTAKTRDIEWTKMLLGHCDIVIGPRSAIFSPLSNIGAIIIDEEHESSYKQDSSPRYATQTIAHHLATAHNALLILGSATPSIESYYYATTHPNWTLVTLTQRPRQATLPPITCIQDFASIPAPLLVAIKKRIETKEKTILLINRRGFSTYISCNNCHHVLSCKECKLSLTYHKDRKLRCHRCSLSYTLTHTCPKCKKTTLNFTGNAIQKIETDLKKLLPKATIIRMDKDTAPNEKKASAILEEFKQNGDILIGTQMVAKGHHIEEVTLVGILGIDSTLNLPDFRSPERTFQLITQVAGRAGRGQKTGEVMIQTQHANHYAIIAAQTHNYPMFYKSEIEYRKQLFYPPFSILVNIIISGKELFAVQHQTKLLYEHLKDTFKSKNIQITPPNPCPIERVRDQNRWHLLIKSPHNDYLHIKKSLLHRPPPLKGTRVLIDYDPQSLF